LQAETITSRTATTSFLTELSTVLKVVRS